MSRLTFPPADQSVAAIVFGDGSQSRLYPLTKRRSEGVIPIAGNYRLIDGVVSNSNITKIYALTQFNSTTLNSHLSRAYSGARLAKEGFVEVIAAYQSLEDKGWFQGTADAVRRCLWVLEEIKKADISVAVLSSMRYHDPGFGSFKVNSENEVTEYRETPGIDPVKSTSVRSSSVMFNDDHKYLDSMGIYVISRDAMIKLLRENFPKAIDLTTQVIPGAIALGMKISAFQFDGYWEDMRSIEAFYDANMENTRKSKMTYNSFYDRDSPVYTLPRFLPPASITDAVITDCVIGDGCILNTHTHDYTSRMRCYRVCIICESLFAQFFESSFHRCNIKGTVVGMRTRVGDGAIIEDSVIMGSDIYQSRTLALMVHGSKHPLIKSTSHASVCVQQTEDERKSMGIPIGIGEGSCIRKAIVDKNARIGKNVMIINNDSVQEGNNEANGYIITAGIVVILRSAVIPDGSLL
ncbi:hypothetical protein RJ639_037251 [Escallonia herrerae]|uniref:Nucleotidyl transferase domain-containing protein n=1 Tax=Escallonia herrerae TaxID=1293975 RepID=A0AA89BG96_9ASTE|nr:hypothetical protein RJ639_037251 [Escallonia herrerae]